MSAAVREMMERLEAAYNSHDVDAFSALFHDDYRSEQPAHPARSFRGRRRLSENWSNVFATVPDLRAKRRAMVVDGDEAWTEWRWTGTSVDGAPVDLRGVIIFGFRDALIAWGRLYMEDVERVPEGDSVTGIRPNRRA